MPPPLPFGGKTLARLRLLLGFSPAARRRMAFLPLLPYPLRSQTFIVLGASNSSAAQCSLRSLLGFLCTELMV